MSCTHTRECAQVPHARAYLMYVKNFKCLSVLSVKVKLVLTLKQVILLSIPSAQYLLPLAVQPV